MMMNPPSDITEENGIYNAICSNDCDFIKRGGHSEIDIAKAYETVKLRNIDVSDNLRLLVENTLLNYRYPEVLNDTAEIETQSKAISEHVIPQKSNLETIITQKTKDLKKQINSICDMNQLNISSIKKVPISEIDKLDISETTDEENIFFYTLTLIAKNIRVVKRSKENKSKRTIWNDVEYYLDYYIFALTNPRKSGMCILLLNKRKLLRYLAELSKLTDSANTTLKNDFDETVENDVKETVALIRNVESLKRIRKYVDVALSDHTGETETMGKLLVERTIQVLGENLKETHVSQSVVNFLLGTWPVKIRETVLALRNSLSHSESLLIKRRLNRNAFDCIKTDIEKIDLAIRYISIEAQHAVLKKVIDEVSSGINVKHMERWIVAYSFRQFQEEVNLFLDDTEKEIKSIIATSQLSDDVEKDIEIFIVNTENKLRSIIALCQQNDDVEKKVKDFVNDIQGLIRSIMISSQKVDDVEKEVKDFIDDIESNICSIVRSSQQNNDVETNVNDFLDDTESRFFSIIIDNDVVNECLSKYSIESKKIKECLYKLKYDIEYIQSAVERSCFYSVEFEAFKENTYKNKTNLFESFLDIRCFCKLIKSQCTQKTTNTKCIDNMRKNMKDKFQNISNIGIFKEQLVTNKNMKAQYFVKDLIHKIGLDMSVNVDESCSIVEELTDFFKNNNDYQYIELLTMFDSFFGDVVKALPCSMDKNSLNDKCKSILSAKDKEIECTFDQNKEIIKQHFPEITHKNIAEGYQIFRKRKAAKYALEMIVMEMLIVWNRIASISSTDSYLDRPAPTLFGVSLRNYLAHGDCLIDSFKGYSRIALYLNARYLMRITINLTQCSELSNISTSLRDTITEDFKRQLLYQQNHFISAQNGNLEIFEIKEIFGSDFLKQNALHYAAQGDRDEFIEKSFESDSGLRYLELENSFRKTVFEWAIKSRSRKVVRLFLNESLKLTDNIQNRILDKGLLLAISSGNEDVVKEILSQYPEYVQKHFLPTEKYTVSSNPGKWNVIHEAAKSGMGSILIELLNSIKLNYRKFYVNERDETQLTPLDVASSLGHLQMVKLLITYGSEPLNEYNPLFLAVRHRQNSVIIHLIEINADISAVTMDDKNILHLSARFCDLEINEFIVRNMEKRCLDDYINQKDSESNTPLDIAVQCNKEETINLFIKVGAAIARRSEAGRDPTLHLAAKCGNKEALIILLKNGANFFALCENGSTVLHQAARAGHLEIIEIVESSFLLQRQHPQQISLCTFTVEHHRAIDKRIETIAKHDKQMKTILGSKQVKPIKENKDFFNARNFLTSSHTGLQANSLWAETKTRIVNKATKQRDYLNHSKCNMNTYSKVKDIINSLKSVQKEIVHEIACLNNLENIELANSTSETDFRTLISEDECVIAKIKPLLDEQFKEIETFVKLADVRELSLCVVHGISELNGDEEAIKELTYLFDVLQRVSFAYLLSITDRYKRTPLHWAAENGHTVVVKKIYYSHKFIVNNADGNGFTALLLATKNGHKETFLDLLYKYEAKLNVVVGLSGRNCLHIASSRGHSDIVKIILRKKKIKIDSRDQKGNTALICAVRKGHKTIVDELLEKKASAEIDNFGKNTPLSVAIMHNYIDIFESIISNKNTKEIACNQPELFHLAISEEREEMVQCLIWKGANVNCIADEYTGDTPLHISSRKGNSRIVELLLNNGADINQKNAKGEIPLIK